ncbi:hypothetical protein HZF05_13120 [Sphingomonas sp. CGMCC 1.13654]|uniref:Uncharacterized protein n=1 Tax=Sphingomonas chungangi TaxID=2683589 RepID=A0A838L8M7_9SPHN|nr:hypothetical protein [Sphingomonas chungangi]MBA2935035.1 hypothetical protein [Sphingomonas chungangi]MVW54151.1 hypothetical protein [Sphingomonas chungangi]
MQSPMAPERIRQSAEGRSLEDVLAMWTLATSEVARSDDWIAIAFEIVRRQRAGTA